MSGEAGRALRRLASTLAVLLGAGVGLEASGLRWQHTASLPRGVYRLDRDAPVRRGSVVLLCLDAGRGRWGRTRGYLTRGGCPGGVEPLGKVVLGVQGDAVDWTADGVRLNGRAVPRTRGPRVDGAGRPLPVVPYGRYVLPAGQLWAYSPYTLRSLDSRYLGPLPLAAVRGVLYPVWVRDASTH